MANKTSPASKPKNTQQKGNRFPDANKQRQDGMTDEEAGVPAADMRKGEQHNDARAKDSNAIPQPNDPNCGCG